MLDFDGSLSEIVARPELAAPVEGAVEAVRALVPSFGLVAVVSGRPTDEVRELLGVEGVRYEGSYGIGVAADASTDLPFAAVEQAAAATPGAMVEPKGFSVAVHYRACLDRQAAREALLIALRPVAEDSGLELIEGKMVVELVPAGSSHKGDVVARLVRDAGSLAALYAGDDLPDLAAFSALDALAAEGVSVMKVAVRGDETPAELLRAADEVVEGPRGLVELLRELA